MKKRTTKAFFWKRHLPLPLYKYGYGSIVLVLLLYACNPPQEEQVPNFQFDKTPIYSFLDNLEESSSIQSKGAYRILALDGKRGINTTSINSAIELPQHNINSDSGALTLWFFALEDLSPFVSFGKMNMHNKLLSTYPLLSDCENPQDFVNANFKLVWDAGWHPNLIGMFAHGKLYEDAYNFPHRAVVTSNHFQFEKRKWYQVALTWNHPKNELGLFVNGVRVGGANQFYPHDFHVDTCNNSLFLGNPTLCYSTVAFYDEPLDDEALYQAFRSEALQFDEALDEELKHTYTGAHRERLSFELDDAWEKKLDLSLTQQQDLDSFYIQGNPVAVAPTPAGLLVETIDKQYHGSLLDSQVYLWSNAIFEGDLYVEYEFKSLRRGGLSLLMTQASGMNREDFMQDYPLRTSGRMSMVCWEDVRNYHWEYYREMADVRNDVASSAMMKNPFMTPMGFGCMNKPLAPDQWHKLQFLQRGNHIIGAMDGIIMIDATDNGMANNGPVLDFGRIAIRCMLHTKMLFRNLKVYNGKTDYKVIANHK